MAREHDEIPARDLMSVRQTSIRTGIPVRTLYRWIRNGKLDAYLVADRLMIHVDDVAPLAQAS